MKIFVWGMGIKFSLLRDRVINIDEVEGYIDNKLTGNYLGKKIYKPQEVADMYYDAIIVANNSTKAIYQQCLNVGIEISKVIFLYKNYVMNPLNANWDLTRIVLGESYTLFLQNKYHIINEPTIDEVNGIEIRQYHDDILYEEDYVRVRTLLLVANMVNNNKIQGEVAEFGVFRGDFARSINRAFCDRKLYLFDTFEGFEPEEAQEEKKQNTCNDSYISAFKNTNIEMVIERMPYPEKVIVKRGYFPESLEGLEERFAFVSLDVDFEESTYNGLEYFYPRLSEGGYIFIHDYNYGFFDRVAKAVERYEYETGNKLKKVPLCDYNGTMVIVK